MFKQIRQKLEPYLEKFRWYRQKKGGIWERWWAGEPINKEQWYKREVKGELPPSPICSGEPIIIENYEEPDRRKAIEGKMPVKLLFCRVEELFDFFNFPNPIKNAIYSYATTPIQRRYRYYRYYRALNSTFADKPMLIGDLLIMQDHQLLKIPNIGKKRILELKYILSLQGLTMGLQIDNWQELKATYLKRRKEMLQQLRQCPVEDWKMEMERALYEEDMLIEESLQHLKGKLR